mmetsp:Transcript_26006/g.49057  ORF Transcript_26006/g.49057 Transcript_26006/m.49057 type:complete len:231 (+) Transcript_26006:2094-2786(+)
MHRFSPLLYGGTWKFYNLTLYPRNKAHTYQSEMVESDLNKHALEIRLAARLHHLRPLPQPPQPIPRQGRGVLLPRLERHPHRTPPQEHEQAVHRQGLREAAHCGGGYEREQRRRVRAEEHAAVHEAGARRAQEGSQAEARRKEAVRTVPEGRGADDGRVPPLLPERVHKNNVRRRLQQKLRLQHPPQLRKGGKAPELHRLLLDHHHHGTEKQPQRSRKPPRLPFRPLRRR